MGSRGNIGTSGFQIQKIRERVRHAASVNSIGMQTSIFFVPGFSNSIRHLSIGLDTRKYEGLVKIVSQMPSVRLSLEWRNGDWIFSKIIYN